MFYVEDVNDGHSYAVKFYHNPKPTEGRPSTTAQVFRSPVNEEVTKENRELIAEGVARLDSRDQFSRPIGRKKALANALKNSNVDKSVREQIWHTYFYIHNS